MPDYKYIMVSVYEREGNDPNEDITDLTSHGWELFSTDAVCAPTTDTSTNTNHWNTTWYLYFRKP
jgi:hypothetical protein